MSATVVPMRKRNGKVYPRYKDGRTKPEYRVLEAVNKGPLIRIRNSYWSAPLRRFYNVTPTDVTAKKLGLQYHSHMHKETLLELVTLPGAEITPADLQQIARDYLIAFTKREAPGRISKNVKTSIDAKLFARVRDTGLSLEEIIELGLKACSQKKHLSKPGWYSQDQSSASRPSPVNMGWL
jgi:hypothetical protein